MTQPARRSPHSNPDLFEAEPPPRTRRRDPREAPWSRSLTVGIEIRMRDTPQGAEAFKHFNDQLTLQIRKRLPEAVLERALRRFAVGHARAILDACSRQRFVGRTVVEEDLIEALDRAFRTGRADEGIQPELTFEVDPDDAFAELPPGSPEPTFEDHRRRR